MGYQDCWQSKFAETGGKRSVELSDSGMSTDDQVGKEWNLSGKRFCVSLWRVNLLYNCH
jgi:hypothetical protein